MGLRMILKILAIAAAAAGPVKAQIRGDATAVAAAERVLANAGGRDAWRATLFEVEERGFLRSGEVAKIRIWRDFAANARRIESVTPSRRIIAWVSANEGWTMRNGELSELAPAELAAELRGLEQEPYAIYHRLALEDPSLRVELRENGSRLMVFDHNERLLNWYLIDDAGNTIGWGNYFDGGISQHHYGPFADMGDAHLPQWGAATDGRWRFEYVAARLRNETLKEPPREAPVPTKKSPQSQ